MDSILQEVIKADQKAQERVETIRSEKANVRRVVEGAKQAIEERYEREARERIDAHKEKLAMEIKTVQKQKDEEYVVALQQLHDTFNEMKTDWTKSIIARCLKEA